MRRAVFVLLAVLIAVGSLSAAENAYQINRVQDDPSFAGYVPNMIIVQLEEDVISTLGRRAMKSGFAFAGHTRLESAARGLGISRVEKKFAGMTIDNAFTAEERALTRFFRVYVDETRIEEAIDAFERLREVTSAYRIPIHKMDATPNDPLYPDQWGYFSTYGIEADMGWELETGDATVVVGIMDSGVKYNHGDLGGTNPPSPIDVSTNGNIWINDQEIPNNGVDDDGNGYVDDVIGYDFVAAPTTTCSDPDCYDIDNDPMDALGHGTHVSGTVAAINNNGYRVSGVAGGWNDGTQNSTANGVKVLCVRNGWAPGYVSMDASADGFVYMGQLKARGVNIASVNCSWGSSETADLRAAVDYIVSQDVLVVVAAGNDKSSYPRYLNAREDCMSVGGVASNGTEYFFSNYGDWVEVAAPAVGIVSTVAGDGDQTASYTGTSMAAPHVTGLAALLESANPSLSRQDKWNIICDPGNLKPYLMQKHYVGAGIPDARLCLEDAGGGGCTQAPVANFSGAPTSGDYPLTVNFTDLSSNSPTAWDWNFGDGSAHAYTQNPSHQYTEEGTYTVTLVATNDCGYDTEIKTGYITVTEAHEAPVAAFTANPTSGTAPLEVTFTDQSTGGATSWAWNFGDGSPLSYVQNPVHTYTSVGLYDVTLTVSNAYGNDSETKYDYINATEAVANSMYVYNMDVWRVTTGRSCDGYVKVWIYDQNNQPLEAANVSVTVSGPVSGTGTAATGVDGSVTFHTGMSKSCSGEFCFEVTNVVKTGYTYNSAANNMTKVCESGVVFKDTPMNAETMMPNAYGLTQNYPNPFNPSTEISFSMRETGHASLIIYNIRGQKVTTLADGIYTAGTHTVTWDASKLASGVYLYRFEAGDYRDIKKMILLK